MRKSNGVTLVSLVVTIVLMMIIMGIIFSRTNGMGLLNKKDETVNQYYDAESNITQKMNSIKDQWSGILD